MYHFNSQKSLIKMKIQCDYHFKKNILLTKVWRQRKECKKGCVQMSEAEDNGLSQGDHGVVTRQSGIARERTVKMGTSDKKGKVDKMELKIKLFQHVTQTSLVPKSSWEVNLIPSWAQERIDDVLHSLSGYMWELSLDWFKSWEHEFYLYC